MRLALDAALDADGRVFSWGKGEDGTLGTGERGSVLKPRLVEQLLRYPVDALACRGSPCSRSPPRGRSWGRDDGQLGHGDGAGAGLPADGQSGGVLQRVRGLMGITVAAVARADALGRPAADGTLFVGLRDDGVLGHGDTRGRRAPTPIVAAAFGGQRVRAVECGSAAHARPPRRRHLPGLGRQWPARPRRHAVAVLAKVVERLTG